MKNKTKNFFDSISNAICPVCQGELITKRKITKTKHGFWIFSWTEIDRDDHEIICTKNNCKFIHPEDGYEIESIMQLNKRPKNKKLRKIYDVYYSGMDEDTCMM